MKYILRIVPSKLVKSPQMTDRGYQFNTTQSGNELTTLQHGI